MMKVYQQNKMPFIKQLFVQVDLW